MSCHAAMRHVRSDRPGSAWRPYTKIDEHVGQRPGERFREIAHSGPSELGPRASSTDSITLRDRWSQGERSPSRRYARALAHFDRGAWRDRCG